MSNKISNCSKALMKTQCSQLTYSKLTKGYVQFVLPPRCSYVQNIPSKASYDFGIM